MNRYEMSSSDAVYVQNRRDFKKIDKILYYLHAKAMRIA